METSPRARGPTSSRESANSSRAGLTAQASAQAKALIAAPIVMRCPTHEATSSEPRSPSREDDAVNAATPASSVPNPITSTAVTNTK